MNVMRFAILAVALVAATAAVLLARGMLGGGTPASQAAVPAPIGITEVLVAATRLGGELMGKGERIGMLQPGYLADLLVVRGDPTSDVRILQNHANITVIMKDGVFYKR